MRIKLASSSLSIACTLALFCQMMYAAPSRDSRHSNHEVESRSLLNRGSAPLTLQPQPNGSYVLGFDNDIPGFGFVCTLLSIDHKVIKDFSCQQIEELLAGPTGSTIELEFLSGDGRVKTTSLIRKAVKNGPMWECDALGITYCNYDNRSARNWNGAFVENSLDLEARASQNLVLREAREYDFESTNAISTAALPAALTDYEVGKIEDGDANLSTCLKTYKTDCSWRLTQNRQINRSIRTLISVHRENEAVRLLKIATEQDIRNGGLELAYEELAAAQLTADRSAAIATLDQFGGDAKKQPNYSNAIPAIAQLYERAGEYNKSAEIYAQVLNARAFWNQQWLGITDMAGYKMHLVLAQDKLGDRSSAMATIQDAINKVEALPADQITNLERMPGLFPRLSDLKIALNALQDGKNLPALNGLETAETLEVFPDIRECDKAITSHDKPKAMHLIDSFFKQYIGHVPNVFKSIEKQNLYCSILTLAREMTNTGWIKESDAVLNRLDKAAEGKDANGLTRGYLRAELAYNASKAKRDASPEWSELESSWHVFPVSQAASKDDAEENDDNATVGRGPVKDIAFSTRLRILALIYYYAGELERAQLYIDQALIAHDSELGQPSEKFVHGNNDSGTQKILMLLDMACIVAKSKQFDKAESLWTQLQTLEVVKGDAYPHTVVELCSIYVDSNRSARAIEILKQTRARSRGLSSHQLDNGYTAMDFMLAKLLKGAGKIKEAKLLVDEAAAEMPKRLGWLDCLLVAQCAEAEGDFAQAGKYYALEPWTSSPSEFVTYSSDKYTEKALECAVKAPTYDKIELSKLYVRVAEIRTNREKRDASELYQKAIDLLPDSDPQKSSLMTRLANSKFYSSSSSSKQPPQKGMSSTQPTDSVGKTLSVNAPPKTNLASEHTEKVQTHLNDLERIANFSETNHHQSVRSDWTNLACAEIAEGDWRKGIEHAQHVIALFSGQCAKYHSNVLGDGADIPALLVRAKHAEEAEKLLLAAVARAQTIAGAKSLQVQGQLKDLFVFYVAQKDYANADTILDKVLACDLTTGETLSQSLSHSHCGQSPPQSADAVEVLWKVFEVLDRAKKNDPVFVKQSFEKILAAQKKVLAQTDERIMPTLTSLGDINFEMQRYDVADGYYSQAFAISKQYHKGEFAVRQVGKHFIENLKKLGRDDEAESLTDARWEGVWKK